MKKIIIALLTLGLFSVSLGAYELPPLDVLNLRSKAMGGVSVAFVDDQYAPVNNPAGMALMKTRYVSILKAQAVISGDFLKAWDQKDELEKIVGGDYNISNDTWNYISNLRLSVGTTPLYLAILNILPFNFNLVVYNTFRTKIKTNPDMMIPTWNLHGYNDTVAMLNWGMNLIDFKYMNLFVGVNAKLVHRLLITRERLDFFAIYDFSNLKTEDLDVMRAFSFGMDLGAIAELGRSKRVRVALTVTDFYGTRFSWEKLNPSDMFGVPIGDAGTQMIEPAVNVGGLIKVGTIIPVLMEDLVISLDVMNVLDKDIDFFLKVYAGLEFRMLGFLKIRAGLYQGWVSAGIGIDIPILPMEINFAYWAEEMGEYPGQQRLDNFGLTVNILW